MAEDSAKKFKTIAVVFLVLFLLLAISFIVVLLRMAKLRRQKGGPDAKAEVAETGGDKKLIEAKS